MKIGIVTLVSDNYGNKYQNYAVEQLLSEYGDVITYPVENRKTVTQTQPVSRLKKLTPAHLSESVSARLMNYYDITNARRSAWGNLVYFLRNRKQIVAARALRHNKFSAFQQKHLHISERVITAANCGEEPWNGSHDVFVCGSDQIWNPGYSTTTELAFLSFARGRAVALAPSFGVSSVSEDKVEKIRNWLTGVDHLSVREEDGSRIIKELTGRDAPVLLDPTMSIDLAEWKRLADKPKTKLPEKYIATYFLGRFTRKYQERIGEISRMTGLPVVNLFQIEAPQYYAFDPAEVLYTIGNASLVLTDSFHGTVFSILFQRDFLVFRRDEGGKSMHSRLSTLLGKFSLENRLDDGNGCVSGVSSETWERVQKIIDTERVRTKAYLDEAIGEVNKR